MQKEIDDEANTNSTEESKKGREAQGNAHCMQSF